MAKNNDSTSWHPAFCAAIRIELDNYAYAPDFTNEYPLTQESLEMGI